MAFRKPLYSPEKLRSLLSREFNRTRNFPCAVRGVPLPVSVPRKWFRQPNWVIPRCGRCESTSCDRLLGWLSGEFGDRFDLHDS
ncbi:MAG TPA: hypothetical protein VLS49_05450 [Usitatibacter sp.]|nr:hypothetical protein [Usitatibacter sp.]